MYFGYINIQMEKKIEDKDAWTLKKFPPITQ